MLSDPVPISLGIRSNPARNRQASGARLTNCFSEQAGEDAKTPWVIYGTPGLVAFGAPLAGGAIRAALEVGSLLYVVAGRNIYTVTTGGAATLIGGIPTDGPVKMVRNRRIPTQIGIVSSGVYVVIDTLANSVTEIFDVDLPSPISISFLDGYGVLPIANGNFMLTGLDDFTTVDGLDIGECSAYPDEIVQVEVLERELVFMGTDSLEFHQDSGDADFPISRIHATEIGCLAANSVAKVDTELRKTLIWVAPDHTVRMMNGYGGTVISTNEIEQLIKNLHGAGRISELKGIAWADSGRFNYSLSCNDWSRCFPSKTGNWYDQKSHGFNRWRISTVVQFGDKLIAGDFQTGQLYELTHNAFDEVGETMIFEIITPIVHAAPYPLKFNALYISAAKGVGLNSEVENLREPSLMVSWSNDGGYSYSAERICRLGKLGERAKRIAPLYRLGRCGEGGRIFRFRISDPVERMMLSAAVSFDKLSP